MLSTYSKFEGLEKDESKRPALAADINSRPGFPSMNTGMKGTNKVSVLAKGLSYKFEGKEDPAAQQPDQPKRFQAGSQSLVGVSALAKDLAIKFRGEMEQPSSAPLKQPQSIEKMVKTKTCYLLILRIIILVPFDQV